MPFYHDAISKFRQHLSLLIYNTTKLELKSLPRRSLDLFDELNLPVVSIYWWDPSL
jgi:hypothetical protein